MSRARLLLLLWFALAGAAAFGDQDVALPFGGEAPADVQDLILLSPTHPVRMRLHIEVNGAPFREAWRKSADAAFDRFDSAKGGRLSAEQAQQLFTIFGGANSPATIAAAPPTPAAMSRNAPQEITREAVIDKLATLSPPFTVQARLSSGGAGPAIFSLLDTDGDQRLSHDELAAAEKNLRCRDFSDDGLLTPEELIQGPAATAKDNPETATGPLIAITPSTTMATLIETLLFRYDRNRDGRLSYAGSLVEIRSPFESFAKFDADHDQSLDRTELLAWLQSPPDIVLQFQLGQKTTGVHAVPPTQPAAEKAYRIRRKLDGGYRLTIAENDLDFRRNNRDPAQASQPPRFADYDQDGDGVLNADELKTANLNDLLALIDTNGDGKIARNEFEAYYDWRNSLAAGRVVLEVTDEGQDLFSLLDSNGDGILSPRELKMAGEILATDDTNHDGYLSSDEIPYRLMLELSRGGPTGGNQPAQKRVAQPRHPKTDRSAPGWFTKMDRNGDGELSPEEFLGTREQFDKIDLNHDGLIDAAEAAAAKPAAK